ncbi:MAG: response regulator [Campylobacterota bacterium]|nr:response regulator [Campylobacterota bacterium]
MNKTAKILVVDDVAENITMIIESLKSHYEVIAATNGSKALELANKEVLPDLILLDIMMPYLDGFDVCKHLKENERTKEIYL